MVRVIKVRPLNARDPAGCCAYVGREWAGWPEHPLHNPFRLRKDATDDDKRRCLGAYEDHLNALADRVELLRELWADCEAGRLPLGCWCGDWDGESKPAPLCHAVILAVHLNRMFHR